jgi:hypothetical protein
MTHADDEADWLARSIKIAEMIEAAELEVARVRAIQMDLREARAMRSAPAEQRRRLTVHIATARLLRRIEPHMDIINAVLAGNAGGRRECRSNNSSMWTGFRRGSRRQK